MTLILVMVFNILVAFAGGFVFGRVYEIRRYERRNGFALPPTARVPSSAAKLLSKDEARRIAANIASCRSY